MLSENKTSQMEGRKMKVIIAREEHLRTLWHSINFNYNHHCINLSVDQQN